MGNLDKNFGLTREDLYQSQRRVPIFSIEHLLSKRQSNKVVDGKIPIGLLRAKQLDAVNEALNLDNTYGELGLEVSSEVHRFL